jgi:hypothetical protein
MLAETVCIILIASIIANEVDKFTPVPYPLGFGDTLMVRLKGYGFCPKYCDIDHFHIGHEENYNCKAKICNHILYEDRLD